MNKEEFKVGDYVRYAGFEGAKEENGRVKSLTDSPQFVFVVYACGNNWDYYQNYTAARTDIKYLKRGWL
jgi:hypothetical protein